MKSLESTVDPYVLERMLDWAKDIDEFERHHAIDGLFNSNGFRVDPSSDDTDALFLVALDCSLWFWIDDRSDKHLSEQKSPVNWDRLIELAEGRLEINQRQDLDMEEIYFLRLSAALESRGQPNSDYQWWLWNAARVFRGMRFEERALRSRQLPSFIESLEYGAASTGVPNIMATAALVYGLKRSARHGDMALSDLERYFSIQQRLLNDLNSAEKERREGKGGSESNLVLLMETDLEPHMARSFVSKELSGVERMISEAMERLDSKDPFVRVISNALNNIRCWYENRPLRYQIVQP